jgi:hypothetical protein
MNNHTLQSGKVAHRDMGTYLPKIRRDVRHGPLPPGPRAVSKRSNSRVKDRKLGLGLGSARHDLGVLRYASTCVVKQLRAIGYVESVVLARCVSTISVAPQPRDTGLTAPAARLSSSESDPVPCDCCGCWAGRTVPLVTGDVEGVETGWWNERHDAPRKKETGAELQKSIAKHHAIHLLQSNHHTKIGMILLWVDLQTQVRSEKLG